MNPSTDTTRTDQLISTMCDRITTITRTLASWMQEQPRTLAEVEKHVLRLIQDTGALLVAGLASLAAPLHPPATIDCPCGQFARYQRLRPATVTTILGRITIHRPYYLCASCGHGQCPLDAQLQMCAGSRSAALDELLAVLGATQDSFAEAATVLEQLPLVQVSPNTVLDATEVLGTTLAAHQAQVVARTMAGHDVPASPLPRPTRLYITMDGVLAHLHERGWSEVKIGCCYQTRSRPERTCPEQLQIRAHSLSYISVLTDAQTFGWHLWQEAARRGVREADEVIVVGDGAHWIWNLAETHFPEATQILDWYHASEYIWNAASEVWGENPQQREAWAHRPLDALWDGKVDEVMAELARQVSGREAVRAALSYYTTHRRRMDYAGYRARGLQIGSGSVESACKQVVSARLKGAGMIWSAEGGEAVATVRAWLKSARWPEAMALRAAPRRGYARKQSCQGLPDEVGSGCAVGQREEATGGREAASTGGSGLAPDVLASVRAQLNQDVRQHPWRKAWSVTRQREQQEQTAETRAARVA